MDILSRRSFNAALASFAGATLLSTGSRADTWPGSKPVTIIMPFPPGGGSDSLARLLAAEFSEKTGGRFVVENRAGAGGNIGAAAFAKSAPDGYTFMLATNGPGIINKLIYKELQYDPQKDFTPVVLASALPAVIAAGPKLPAKNFKELITYAKANPKKVTFGSPGNGTLGHIVGVLFQRENGVEFTHVPYKGSAPLTADLLGGQVDLAGDLLSTYVQHINADKLSGIAVISKERNEDVPKVPTATELGIKGLESSGWCSVLAPTGTPPDIIAKVNKMTNDYIKTDKGKAALKAISMVPVGGTPQELGKFLSAEYAKWQPVIKAANISVD